MVKPHQLRNDGNTTYVVKSPRTGFTVMELIIVAAIIIVLIALMLPAVRTREPGRRSVCKNNLKQIGLAFHNYHDDYGTFPPAYTVDADGNRLHSWRTLILPYVDQQELYDQIDLSRPWDDLANAAALETSIGVYRCPSVNIPENHTVYMAIVGDDAAFRPDGVRALADFTDGTSETLMVIEVPASDAVPWMAPTDVGEALLLRIGSDTELNHKGGIHALFADGHVRYLSADLPEATRRALISIAGGDSVGDF